MRDYSELRAKAAAATPGEWTWWTSNSYLRLSSERGGDGDILHGAVLRDGCCTVNVSEQNREHIAAASPATILALLDELDALRAASKPAKAKDCPPEFNQAYEAMKAAGIKWRSGSTPKAALIQWKARIKAGATPAEMIAGAEGYARYCKATGCEIKMAQTFFGPGEHFGADWTVRTSAPASRPGKFDPVAHVNQGRAASGKEWDDRIIDITPR